MHDPFFSFSFSFFSLLLLRLHLLSVHLFIFAIGGDGRGIIVLFFLQVVLSILFFSILTINNINKYISILFREEKKKTEHISSNKGS